MRHTVNLIVCCRSANLILNLFSLMVDANIPDIVLEPDKTVKKVSHPTNDPDISHVRHHTMSSGDWDLSPYFISICIILERISFQLYQVQDKFLLNLSDEEAAKEMQGMLEVSVSALMPAIAETFHRFAQVGNHDIISLVNIVYHGVRS